MKTKMIYRLSNSRELRFKSLSCHCRKEKVGVSQKKTHFGGGGGWGRECDTGGWPQLWQYNLGSPAMLTQPPKTLSLAPSSRHDWAVFTEQDLRGLSATFSRSRRNRWGSVSALVSGGRKRDVRPKKESVTMEMPLILLWELEQQSTLCLGSSWNRLSERSLW